MHAAQFVGEVALHLQRNAQLGAQRDGAARVGRFQVVVVVMPGVPCAAFPAEGALDGEFAALPVDVRLEERQRFLGTESGFESEAEQGGMLARGAGGQKLKGLLRGPDLGWLAARALGQFDLVERVAAHLFEIGCILERGFEDDLEVAHGPGTDSLA